jgi:hypothetical protein
MYALSGVRPVDWTFYGPGTDSQAGYLGFHLNNLAHDPRVRQALNNLKVRYVIVGKGMVTPAQQQATGLVNLAETAGFQEVYRNPDAVIYAIQGQQNVVASGAATASAAGHG